MGSAGPLAIFQGLGAVAGLGDAYTQSRAIRSQGRFQVAGLEEQARRLERQGEDIARIGAEEERHFNRSARQFMGSQRAAYASQGVELGRGTPLDVMKGDAAVAQEDAHTIRVNTLKQLYGYKSEALTSRTNAQLARISSRTASRATLLGGILEAGRGFVQAGSLYGKYK